MKFGECPHILIQSPLQEIQSALHLWIEKVSIELILQVPVFSLLPQENHLPKRETLRFLPHWTYHLERNFIQEDLDDEKHSQMIILGFH